MNKKNSSFFHLGFSSVLMVFIMLCLITFAALSLVTANSDYRLSKKTADKTTNYYNADTTARAFLKDVDSILFEQSTLSADSISYQSNAANSIEQMNIPDAIHDFSVDTSDKITTVSFSVSISDVQSLYVSINVNVPENDNDNFYRITRWQTKTSNEPADEDQILNLYNGNN